MLKANKYRIYPNKEQSILLNKHIGSSRFVYNLALECKTRAYASKQVNLSCFDLVKQLPDLKKECEWLKEINSQSLQQSIVNLDSAFTNFFKGRAKFPNFKNRNSSQSFNVPQSIIIENDKLYIPKFKKGIDIVLHRNIDGEIRQATISRTPTGKYFASILVDNKKEIPNKCDVTIETSVGLDLGIKSFLVSSNGETFDNPKFLKKQISKLKYAQRKFSKSKSRRRKKRLARLHEVVANQRRNFLHQTSSKIISENQTIIIEDLAVKNMIKNHNLAQSISDCSWGTFRTMLEYKSNWYGKNLFTIGRFEPSSKTCNICGNINKGLTLKDREWQCKTCNTTHDRDLTAAINIKNFGLRNHLSVERRLKNRKELPTLVGVMTCEAHTPLGCG